MKANETKPEEITSVHCGNSISAIVCNLNRPEASEGPVIGANLKKLRSRALEKTMNLLFNLLELNKAICFEVLAYLCQCTINAVHLSRRGYTPGGQDLEADTTEEAGFRMLSILSPLKLPS